MQEPEALMQRLLQSRIARGLVNLCAITFIAYSLWQAWSVLQPAPSTVSEISDQMTPAATDRSQTKLQVLVNQLPEFHLFGNVQTEAGSPNIVPDDAPDTQLQLVLHGLYVEQPEGYAYAIIQHQGKEQQHFKPGDSVFGLAMLHAIYPDRVILDRKGRFETLRLPVDRSEIIVRQSSGRDDTQSNSNKGESPSLDEFEYYVTLSPELDDDSEDDRLLGFEITPANDQGKEWLRKLGLQAGDIIVSINGIRLDTEQSRSAIESAIDSGSPVSVVINRGGAISGFTLQ